MRKNILGAILLLFCQLGLADHAIPTTDFHRSAPAYQAPFEPTRYSILGYYGRMTRNTLGQVIGMAYILDDEKLYSCELSRYFASESGIRRFFGPLISKLALTINFTYHDDPYVGSIYEFDPYLYASWHLFTIPCFASANIAVGEGMSYLTATPTLEHRNSDDTKKLLNYLMFELVFSSPVYTKWEIVGRIHHRSGVFGLYNANNSGATAVGLALRYFFW